MNRRELFRKMFGVTVGVSGAGVAALASAASPWDSTVELHMDFNELVAHRIVFGEDGQCEEGSLAWVLTNVIDDPVLAEIARERLMAIGRACAPEVRSHEEA